MCGIVGIINLKNQRYENLEKHLRVMNDIQKHRGPDGEGVWTNTEQTIGFGHKRLSIIDLSDDGKQPMINDELSITFNGEIYNYIELKEELKDEYNFKTNSDTEVILASYRKWGKKCVNHFRGMFAFAIWNDNEKKLFCARDRFGIKPFYYANINGVLYFASEAKSILPFFDKLEVNKEALKDYLYFQFYLNNKTLFKGIEELGAAHTLTVKTHKVEIKKYWEVYYDIDFDHSSTYFEKKLKELIEESVKYHMRSDVPVGAYASGGIDSSLMAVLASKHESENLHAFHGKFSINSTFDESPYAESICENNPIELFQIDINSQDFVDSIRKITFHMDNPVAGPGSFAQYMTSKLASSTRKVVLGGQGGDEIFGGYTRYLVAYFEQCIKGAIDGTLDNGNFVVTYESIIPNLISLKNYKPMLKQFWSEGLFEDIDKRYYSLINRAPDLGEEIHWARLGEYDPYESFSNLFNSSNVGKESYFDKMTHFDFKTQLPALLHVEDRMSMAHGLEARVPFLDHEIVEFAATIPADIKFKNGTLKKLLVESTKEYLPEKILNRKDKMGFPVPLNLWMKDELKEFVISIFDQGPEREYFNKDLVKKSVESESQFGRKVWGLLSLELWYQEFIDKHDDYKNLLK